MANRLLLWAIAGFATVLLCAVIGACMRAGLAPLRHALPLSAIGAAALCVSTCWTLAFLPPAWYLAVLRGPFAHRSAPSPSTQAP